MKYSKKIKIDRAKVLLLTTNKSMLDIAISLGFYDQSHFSKTFKSFEGVSPSEFRNTHYNYIIRYVEAKKWNIYFPVTVKFSPRIYIIDSVKFAKVFKLKWDSKFQFCKSNLHIRRKEKVLPFKMKLTFPYRSEE